VVLKPLRNVESCLASESKASIHITLALHNIQVLHLVVYKVQLIWIGIQIGVMDT